MDDFSLSYLYFLFHMQRIGEIKALVYRIAIAYLFFGFCRLLFVYFNTDVISIANTSELLQLCYLGIRFDTTAILYLLSPFILLSILPGRFTTTRVFQKTTRFTYFFGALIGMGLNFIDFAYYRFNLARMNANFFEVVQNEQNKTTLFLHFINTYFYLIALFLLLALFWRYLYRQIKIDRLKSVSFPSYIFESLLFFFACITLTVGGIRGDFKKSTRPIAPIHAMEKVRSPQQADIVLNTPFTIIRTLGKMTFEVTKNYSPETVRKYANPIKHYPNNAMDTLRPNVVLIILESMGREYWGALNEDQMIADYESFTPFLDSLAQHSLRFPNFYANSRKSIHGMPAILAGIPSFETAYTSSPYATQKIESVVSIANSLGYDTSFFHGAPNGSMGFQGFATTLGFDHYYGKNEYGNDHDFDGYWGIWDEPFLQFMKSVLDTKRQPFFSTIFTVTSHEPYIIPEEFKGKFKLGHVPMHQCVGYTDYALKRFFEAARTQAWFDNTLFIFTADHGNQTHFDYYKKIVNRFANPLMIYDPKGQLKGKNRQLAQHMDIYPTLVDLMHYDQPFRSWGQSLVASPVQEPFVINYFGGSGYFMINKGYICVSNGEKTIGIYRANDHDLKNNLIDSVQQNFNNMDIKMHTFIQDYMHRVINRKLTAQQK